MIKSYSEVNFIIDVIINEYNIINPILIADQIKEDFDMEISIHTIADYLSINYKELEKINRKQYY